MTIALNQTLGGKKWYVSTAQPQLALLQLYLACRSFCTLHLEVKADTPRYLWADIS